MFKELLDICIQSCQCFPGLLLHKIKMDQHKAEEETAVTGGVHAGPSDRHSPPRKEHEYLSTRMDNFPEEVLILSYINIILKKISRSINVNCCSHFYWQKELLNFFFSLEILIAQRIGEEVKTGLL